MKFLNLTVILAKGAKCFFSPLKNQTILEGGATLKVVFDEGNLDKVLKELEDKEILSSQCLVSIYIGKLLKDGRVIEDDKIILQSQN